MQRTMTAAFSEKPCPGQRGTPWEIMGTSSPVRSSVTTSMEPRLLAALAQECEPHHWFFRDER